jgi:hypothetical protein
MQIRAALFALLLSASTALACDLRYDPVSAPHFYREAGWQLPGIQKDSKTGRTIEDTVSGVKAYSIRNSYPDVITFPEQEFVLNGKRQKTHADQFEVSILRWEIDRRVIAYSYRMIPVTAHQKNGKWIVDSIDLCTFTLTFVDDRGDGVFRLLAPNKFTPDLVPRWARHAEN